MLHQMGCAASKISNVYGVNVKKIQPEAFRAGTSMALSIVAFHYLCELGENNLMHRPEHVIKG